MSTKRYIELVSARRNRNMYPLVSDFVVPIAGTNLCYDVQKAVDPVCNTAPIYALFLNSIFPPNMPVNPNTYDLNLGVNYSNSTLQLDPSNSIVDPSYTTGGRVTNNMYRAYNTNDGTKGYIVNDVDVAYTIDGVPTTGAYRKIVGMSANSIGATLDVPMPYVPPATGSGDTYHLFDGSSQDVGTNFNYNQYLLVNTQPYDIFGKPTPAVSELYTGYYLCLQHGAYRLFNTLDTNAPFVREILAHNTDRSYFRVNEPLTIDNDNEYYQPFTVRKAPPTTYISVNNNTIATVGYVENFPPPTNRRTVIIKGLGASPSTISSYVGQFLFITPYASDPITFVNYPTYPRLNDNNAIKSAYFYRILEFKQWHWDGTHNNPEFILDHEIVVDNYAQPTTPTPVQDSRIVEILPVSYDNFVPLNYTGSVVSQTESVCYEIELNSLTLPNVTLKSGSRIAFYPYVYVSLENVTAPNGGNKNIFYTNNPAATSALFVAPVTDLNNPLTTPFVRINGFGIVQTVKFKPNDALHFKVYLPDGSPFDPVEPDDFSPQAPNPLLQISATFGIRRL